MSLAAYHGTRSIDPANNGLDIPPTDRSSGTVNGASSLDMKDHASFLAVMSVGVIDASTNVTLLAQESNEAAANFTNISGASTVVVAAANNTAVQIAVDWRNPDRLRYVRVVGVVAGSNSALYGVSSLRLDPLVNDGAVGADVTVVNA